MGGTQAGLGVASGSCPNNFLTLGKAPGISIDVPCTQSNPWLMAGVLEVLLLRGGPPKGMAVTSLGLWGAGEGSLTAQAGGGGGLPRTRGFRSARCHVELRGRQV